MKFWMPVSRDLALDSPVSGHFGSAPYYLLVDSETLAFTVVPNARAAHEHGACSPIEAMEGRGVEAVLVGGIGAGAVARLAAAGIAVLKADAPTAREALEQVRRGLATRIGAEGACGSHGRGHAHGHEHEPGPAGGAGSKGGGCR